MNDNPRRNVHNCVEIQTTTDSHISVRTILSSVKYGFSNNEYKKKTTNEKRQSSLLNLSPLLREGVRRLM